MGKREPYIPPVAEILIFPAVDIIVSSDGINLPIIDFDDEGDG